MSESEFFKLTIETTNEINIYKSVGPILKQLNSVLIKSIPIWKKTFNHMW
jgi:hypothetical protein